MTDSAVPTVAEMLARNAPSAPAIGAPDREWLTHGALRALAERTVAALNGMGIGRNDRVAIVAPNGPEMATAFLSIACGATTAPLNPSYKADEYEFYLTDLKAKALVVQHGFESTSREVAHKLGIPVLELVPQTDSPAGSFSLRADSPLEGTPDRGGFAGADDIALVLHTSGTTARPKIVPLSQSNIMASAHHIGQTLALTQDDVCLNIMPLFHIHGLIAAVLSSIAAGGSAACTPGLNAFKFFGWMTAVRPTSRSSRRRACALSGRHRRRCPLR
jgi:acyl-CoA synthetase (AMP-forming)/AMP-acid ligase II